MTSSTRFGGPVETGKKTGTAYDTRGTLIAAKRVSVSADGAYPLQYLPASNIIEFVVNVEVAYTVTAQTAIRFGTTADATKYGQVNVSAVGTYRSVAVSAINLLALSSGAALVVDVTSVGNLGDGQASVYVQYQQLESDGI